MTIFAVIATDYTSGAEQLIMNTTDFKTVIEEMPNYYEKGTNYFMQVWDNNSITKIFQYLGYQDGTFGFELMMDFEDGEDNE